MKNKKMVLFVSIVLAACLITGIAVYAATSLGTQDDPLITLSYLTDSLRPQLMSEVEQEVNAAAKELETSFNNAIANAGGASTDTYKVITLTNGQTLTGDIGCEIMLREGSATAYTPSSTVLSDASGGTGLNGGSVLTANHLYLVGEKGDGIAATSGVKLLVRGTFSIG